MRALSGFFRVFASSLLLTSASIAALGCGSGGPANGTAQVGDNPILFVTQVPVTGFAVLSSLFGNHPAGLNDAPRGGDLYIRYPDGELRNLTKEAGFGAEGLQGEKGIAVREPAVHWDGKKAVFSMVVGGAGKQFEVGTFRWQLYEIEGLAPGEKAVITKVRGQPEDYNNVSPIYGTDDRILFTSDRPRGGEAHLYPQLDEYESTPTVTGLYSLEPSSGDLALLNHTASGVFSPFIDSFGRVIFTKWDHLQRDQQADADNYGDGEYGSFNYADESADAEALDSNAEVFPEPRVSGPDLPSNTATHTFNQFFPWQINEDGSGEETLNHAGRQELGGQYSDPSFNDDENLSYYTPEENHSNRFYVDSDGGFFHIKEDPTRPGVYFATNASEFGTSSGGGLLTITGDPSLQAEAMVVTALTAPITRDQTDDGAAPDPLHTGHYRNPLPLADGNLVAVHTRETRGDKDEGGHESPRLRYDYRLRQIVQQGAHWSSGDPLTEGITKAVQYYDPDTMVSFSGALWELDPVEVRSRTRPPRRVEPLEDPELTVLKAKGVDPAALRAWLTERGLALIVSRDVTSRDRSDVQQPYNLRVPNGVESMGKPGKVYDVSYLQLFQGDQLRGYSSFGKGGRRVLPAPLHDPAAVNPALPGAAPGSVTVALDGSTAAFVPARRAMTWQLTGPDGSPVVRERNWVSFAPGEIRVCASCHGVNTADQAGRAAPQNPPEALGALLDVWKQNQ